MKKSTQTRIKLFGGKASQRAKKVLALLLGVVMLVGVLPGLLGAHEYDNGHVTYFEGEDNKPTQFQFSGGLQEFEDEENTGSYASPKNERVISIKEAIEQIQAYGNAINATATAVYAYAALATNAPLVANGVSITINGTTVTKGDTYDLGDRIFVTTANIISILAADASQEYIYTASGGGDLVATAKTAGAIGGNGPKSAAAETSGGIVQGATLITAGAETIIGQTAGGDNDLLINVAGISLKFVNADDGVSKLESAYFVDELGLGPKFGIIGNSDDYDHMKGEVGPLDLPYFAPVSGTPKTTDIAGIRGNPKEDALGFGNAWIHEMELIPVGTGTTFGSAIAWVLQHAFIKALNWYSEDAAVKDTANVKFNHATGEWWSWKWGDDGELIATANTDKANKKTEDAEIVFEPANNDMIIAYPETGSYFGPFNTDDESVGVQNDKTVGGEDIITAGRINWSETTGTKPQYGGKNPSNTTYIKGKPAKKAEIKLDFNLYDEAETPGALAKIYGKKIQITGVGGKPVEEYTLVEEVPSHILAGNPDIAKYWIDVSECNTARLLAEAVLKRLNGDDAKYKGSAVLTAPGWIGYASFVKAHPDYGKLVYYRAEYGEVATDKLPKVVFPYTTVIEPGVRETYIKGEYGVATSFGFDVDVYVERAINSMLGDEDGDGPLPPVDDEVVFTINVGYGNVDEIDITYRYVSGSVEDDNLIGVFTWKDLYRFSSSNGPGWWTQEKTLADAFLKCLNEVFRELRYEKETTNADGTKEPAYYEPYWIFDYDKDGKLVAELSEPGEWVAGPPAWPVGLTSTTIKNYTIVSDIKFGAMSVLNDPDYKNDKWDWTTASKDKGFLFGPVTVDEKSIVDGEDGVTAKIILEFDDLVESVVGSFMTVEDVKIYFVAQGEKGPDGHFYISVPDDVVVKSNDANVAWAVGELLSGYNWIDPDGEPGDDLPPGFEWGFGGGTGDTNLVYLNQVYLLQKALKEYEIVDVENTRVILYGEKWTPIEDPPEIKLQGGAFVEDPPSAIATLKSLTWQLLDAEGVDVGEPAAITLANGKVKYDEELPFGTLNTAKVKIAGTPTDVNAELDDADAIVTLADGKGIAKIVVTAEDEVTKATYEVSFSIAPPPPPPPPPPPKTGGGSAPAATAAPAIAASKNVTEFVTALYKIALDRAPDPGGLANWTGLITSGKMTPAVVVKHFLLAEETVAKNLSHAQFVELLYNIFMGRKSDAAGLANWVGLLVAGMSREAVINHFFASVEFTAIQAAWK